MIGGRDDGDTRAHNAVVLVHAPSGEGWVDGRTKGSTGTLIRPDLVVTAAHPLPWIERRGEGVTSEHTNPGAWIDLEDWSDGARRVTVIGREGPLWTTTVEAFNKPGTADMALLGLQNPVPADKAAPAGVLTTERPWGRRSASAFWREQRFRMTGYGVDADGQPPSFRQTADADAGRYPESPRFRNKIVVTGVDGASSTQGDSGGPLFWRDPERGEVVVGVNQAAGNRFIATFSSGGLVSVGDAGFRLAEPDVARWLRTYSRRAYATQIESTRWDQNRPRLTLFSWWNSELGDNLATTDGSWIGAAGDEHVLLHASDPRSRELELVGWRFSRREADIFSPNRPMPEGTVRLWSWWSPSRCDQRTTSDSELASTEPNPDAGGLPRAIHGLIFPFPDYECIRLEGYVYAPDRPQPPGTVPLFTYYSPERKDHHLTTTSGMDHRDYRLVRKEGYAYPPSERPPILPDSG